MATTKKWLGSPIENCEACGGKVGEVFYDAYTIRPFILDYLHPATRWAILCHGCFQELNGKLGTGRGQKYDTKTLEKLEG